MSRVIERGPRVMLCSWVIVSLKRTRGANALAEGLILNSDANLLSEGLSSGDLPMDRGRARRVGQTGRDWVLAESEAARGKQGKGKGLSEQPQSL